MIVELREYRFHPGKLPDFLEIYRAGPLELQRRILGNLIGYFTAETGVLNQTVHLWGYTDFDDRLRRRRQLASHPEWCVFLATVLPMLQSQESTLLLPTDFSPMT